MLSTADDSYCWYLPNMEEIECSESYLVHSANSARYGTKMNQNSSLYCEFIVIRIIVVHISTIFYDLLDDSPVH